MQSIGLRSSPNRSRLAVVVLVAVVVILFLSANGVAGFYTDWLWYRSLGQSSLWYRIIGTKVALAASFTLIFFLLFWGNLALAERFRPDHRPPSAEDDLVERYHQVVGGHGTRVRVGISVLFAFVAGANTSSQWQSWMLFRHAQTFGYKDPEFGSDAGFYVFELPFQRFLVSWLFASLILTLVVVLIAHYLNGGIRAVGPRGRVAHGVKLQVSILLATLAVLRAVGYWFDRYALVRSTRGEWDGALATDVNIQEPAYNLLALISLACAVAFIYNIRRNGWGLPLIVVGIWIVSHFVVGSIFPAVYQRLRVVPDTSQREAEYVGRNIEATRYAYNLNVNDLTITADEYEHSLTPEALKDYTAVLHNAPVVDPSLAVDEVEKSEGERRIYQFSEPLDVDRYVVDGEEQPVVLSTRMLNTNVTGSGWESQHIIFTHGYGMVMASASDNGSLPSVGDKRELNLLVRGLGDIEVSPGLNLTVDQPRIYYGNGFFGHAIVGASRPEADYQTDDNQSIPYRYTGDGGVPMGSFVRRLAFALRFRQIDPLVSRNVVDGSKVIYNRDVLERVRLLAPFLRFDQDPYPIVADGKILWVLDGYTTSNNFPYSQSAQTAGLSPSADLSHGYNYVRDSVKITVDAYDGHVTMYAIDPDDPVLAAWRAAFPELFVDGSEMPDVVRDHLRYPQDLFTVQTEMWSTYVLSKPTDFIEGALAWAVANQPRPEAEESESADTTPTQPMKPQYLMARVPGSDKPEYVLQRAFVPTGGADGTATSRPELTAIMMARSDPANYGELVLVRLPAGEVNAPDRVHSEIRKSSELNQFVLDNDSAKVEFGEMTMVLAGKTIVYLRPVYVEANSDTAVPELQRIVAVSGDRIAMSTTVAKALEAVVDRSIPTVVDGNVDNEDKADEDKETVKPPGDGDYVVEGKSVVELITTADEFLRSADRIEKDNPTEAARLRANARLALAQAERLLGGTSTVPSGGAGT